MTANVNDRKIPTRMKRLNKFIIAEEVEEITGEETFYSRPFDKNT
jgi:hypothetical protein